MRLACAVLLLLASGPAVAAPLTLDAALARAEQVSVALQLQALSSEAAEAEWLADPRAGAPSIRVGLRDLVPPVGALTPDPPTVETTLRVPLPRPWELATAATQGKATVAREDAELDALRADVRLAVTERFHALPLHREAVVVADRLAALREQQLALVEERRREGLATALDWLSAEEERRDSDDRRAGRVADLEATEAELRLLLEWPPEESLELVEEPRLDPATIDAALPPPADDPSVREAEAEIARAEARLQRLSLAGLPWLDWAQGGAVFKPGRRTEFELGVAIDVPVFMWSPARTRAASQEVTSAKLRLREVEHLGRDRRARRERAAGAARERWRVEVAHRDAVAAQTGPLLELADPFLRLELQARVARAELRVLAAYIDLVEELDRRAAQSGG